MIKRILFLLLAAISLQQAAAQESYQFAAIPATLKPRANAVVRNQETIVHMQSADQVVITVKKVITVLNQNGDRDAAIHLYYDKNTSIRSLKGEIYDAFGRMSGKFNLSNFKDESAISRYSLFEDGRIKYFQPQMITYPYTLVYHYEIRNKQNLLIPDWYVNRDAHVAIEKTSYTFLCKPEDKVNIKQYHFPQKATEINDGKIKSYTWEAKNLHAYRDEPFSPPAKQILAHIKIAPEKFYYYKSSGTYNNWKELGKWMYDDLIQNRQTLSSATIELVKDLVKDLSDPKEKAKRIYEYVQKKTRYVSVQQGIGGFQPVHADEVDQVGYGDCKGLVNYMQSLLKAVDIPSYYCVVNAGSEKSSLDRDFASMNQANHIILALPFKNDTTWLECTSQTAPFGFLGDFTDDRLVLACTEEGGKLLRTPELKTAQNLTYRKANLRIDQDGSINGEMSTLYKGSQYDNLEHLISQSPEERVLSLKKKYDIDNINFSKIDFIQIKSADPITEEHFTLHMKHYLSKTQNRAYLVLNPFNKKNNIPEVSNRTKALYINRGYTDQDIITYHLPDGFVLEAKPQDILINNEFGSYELKTTINDKQLILNRKLVINNGNFPAVNYAGYVAFISVVHENDHGKMVFTLN